MKFNGRVKVSLSLSPFIVFAKYDMNGVVVREIVIIIPTNE